MTDQLDEHTGASDSQSADSHGPAVRRLADWDHGQLHELAGRFDTPVYITDLDRITDNYHRFDAAFEDARVMYAAKANTGQAVLSRLIDEGVPIECAAAGELDRAIAAGAPPNELRYTAVNPPGQDLDYAVDLWERDAPGLTITAGATDTLDRLAERGYDGRVAIRVNPGIGAGHHEKVATGKDAKFGIHHELVPDVVADARERFNVVGLHAHVGSGMLTDDDLDAHRRAFERVARVAREVGDLEFVDAGGGFGVPYREDQPPLDLSTAAEQLESIFESVDARLELEPGRYIVADASLVLTRVNTIKEAPPMGEPTESDSTAVGEDSTTVVGVDASLSTMIRPAMFDSYHPIRNVSAPHRDSEPVSVGGPCCTSADVFCTDRPVARPDRGDLLAIGNTGAYGIEIASRFHSQPLPPEVGLDRGDVRLLRDGEVVADLRNRERS